MCDTTGEPESNTGTEVVPERRADRLFGLVLDGTPLIAELASLVVWYALWESSEQFVDALPQVVRPKSGFTLNVRLIDRTDLPLNIHPISFEEFTQRCTLALAVAVDASTAAEAAPSSVAPFVATALDINCNADEAAVFDPAAISETDVTAGAESPPPPPSSTYVVFACDTATAPAYTRSSALYVLPAVFLNDWRYQWQQPAVCIRLQSAADDWSSRLNRS